MADFDRQCPPDKEISESRFDDHWFRRSTQSQMPTTEYPDPFAFSPQPD